MHIQPYCEQLERKVETSPAILENRKNFSDFGKEGPDFVYAWVKFSIQNVVLTVSTRKNSKMFSCGASFSCIFDEMFIEAC